MIEIGVGCGYIIDDADAARAMLTRTFESADEFIDAYFTACGRDPALIINRERRLLRARVEKWLEFPSSPHA